MVKKNEWIEQKKRIKKKEWIKKSKWVEIKERIKRKVGIKKRVVNVLLTSGKLANERVMNWPHRIKLFSSARGLLEISTYDEAKQWKHVKCGNKIF